MPIGELDPCGPDPLDTFERSGHFTPYTAVCNVTGSPAISLPLYQHDDGLPLAVQLIGRPAQEGALLALAAQIEAAAPWAGRVRAARPRLIYAPAPSTSPIARGVTPSDSASAVPCGEVIDTSSSSASSHVAGARDFMNVSTTRSPRLTIGVGTWTSGRGAAGGAQRDLGDLAVGERLRACQLVASAAVVAGAVQRRRRSPSATSSAQIGWYSARPRPLIGTAGSTIAIRSSRVRNASPGA